MLLLPVLLIRAAAPMAVLNPPVVFSGECVVTEGCVVVSSGVPTERDVSDCRVGKTSGVVAEGSLARGRVEWASGVFKKGLRTGGVLPETVVL